MIDKKCEHHKHNARWDYGGWRCMNCGEIEECTIKFTKKDLTPIRNKDGSWSAPDPCCPAAPHPEEDKN